MLLEIWRSDSRNRRRTNNYLFYDGTKLAKKLLKENQHLFRQAAQALLCATGLPGNVRIVKRCHMLYDTVRLSKDRTVQALAWLLADTSQYLLRTVYWVTHTLPRFKWMCRFKPRSDVSRYGVTAKTLPCGIPRVAAHSNAWYKYYFYRDWYLSPKDLKIKRKTV